MGLSSCSGLNSAFGSHHRCARSLNFCSSWGSALVMAEAASMRALSGRSRINPEYIGQGNGRQNAARRLRVYYCEWARLEKRASRPPEQAIKKAPPKRGFDTAVTCSLLLRSTDNFDFHATIRCEAGDELLVVLLVATGRDRVALALAFRIDTVGFDALADEVCLHSLSTAQRQTVVVLVRTDTVRVTRCDDDFKVQRADLRCQIVQLFLASRLQDCLVKVEQCVSLIRNLLARN